MNTVQAIRQAVGRAGLTGLQIEKLKIMSGPSYSRKIRDPSKFTLGELKKLNKEVNFTDEEIRALFSN
ncbi:MAG: hypothetical protein K6G85_11235 [Eubacterium sp.]|nr:hypothetical protein [Eubacterium sp.]